ncbi:MAG: hypothetical protein NTW29_09025 [Bacteroidetes bacterium]|nr:hypothetical protein [Bacteroidota bacterium]
MRKTILGILLVAMCSTITAQVQIQTTLPVAGLVQRNQLWDLVLQNNTSSSITGRLEMVLTDRQTAQELLTATTAEFTLQRGAQPVNVNKLNPIQYNYVGYEPDQRMNDLFKAGAYTVCYTFVVNPLSQKAVPVAEECSAFDVEPLSPPALTFPADSSVWDVQPAQFTWMPPTPASMLSGLHYELRITEVQPTQKAAEAMQENTPFYTEDIITGNFMTYPAALPAFEKDKWYAWQVVAKDEKNYAGQSETWVFKVASPQKMPDILNGIPYVQLKMNGGDKTIAPNGILRFYYFNQTGEQKMEASLIDITEKNTNDPVKLSIDLVRGQNYIQKDLSRMISFQEGHVYMLTTVNGAGEKWYIMFEVKKYKN